MPADLSQIISTLVWTLAVLCPILYFSFQLYSFYILIFSAQISNILSQPNCPGTLLFIVYSLHTCPVDIHHSD